MHLDNIELNWFIIIATYSAAVTNPERMFVIRLCSVHLNYTVNISEVGTTASSIWQSLYILILQLLSIYCKFVTCAIYSNLWE